MKVKILGKDINTTEAIKEYTEKRISKLEKYFDENTEVSVTIRSEKNIQEAEMQINYQGMCYRAESKQKDLYASIDKDMDIIEGQLRKSKAKKEKQTKGGEALRDLFKSEDTDVHEVEGEIIKINSYDIKPIMPEDAILKLEENPKAKFLVFVNVETNKVNAIYKTKDGKNYGLVEPEV